MSLSFFLFNLFLEARAEILKKNFVGLLVQTMTPKVHFEINWPLVVHNGITFYEVACDDPAISLKNCM